MLVAGLVALGACGGRDGETVRVSAAASLTDAFGEIADAFESEHAYVEVELNFAGSSSLREQVLEGAPVDVYASADASNMARLVDEGAVVDDPVVFATNRVVIGVPDGNPGEVGGLADLARADLLVGLCAVGVPCGDLARDALARAGVEASVDTEESSVRALATRLAAEELDAGIVYSTEVLASPDIDGIPIAEAPSAQYPIAALVEAPNPTAADVFIEFVLSPQGREILVEHGFGAS